MAYTPIIILFVLLLLNIPVAYALICSTGFYFLVVNNSLDLSMIFQKMVAQGESFNLLAVPFFVTVGVVMNYSGIASRLIKQECIKQKMHQIRILQTETAATRATTTRL